MKLNSLTFSALPLWLQSVLQPLASRFAEILAQSFFINVLALAVPLFSLQVYDRVVGHRGVSTLVALVIGVVLAVVFDYVLRQARSKMLQDAAGEIDRYLGDWLYQRLIQLPLAVIESKPMAYWRGLFQDAQLIRSLLSGHTAMLLADMPFALLFLVVIAVIATPIVWVLLVVVPLFALLAWHSTHRQGEGVATQSRSRQHHEAFIAELLAGGVTVKALQMDVHLAPQWQALMAQTSAEAAQLGRVTDRTMALGQTLGTASTIMLVGFGALAIIDQQMSMGALIATTMLAGRIIAPLNQLLTQWRSIARFRQAIHRLDGLMTLPVVVQPAAIERPRPRGFLRLEGVGYAYEKPLLSGVSLALHPDEMVGIVGRNGCGKTTLLKLLQGLYAPKTGRVLLDDIDMAQLSRDELTRWIGYVPQDTFLMSGTIRENLTAGWPEAEDASILAAVRIAGAEGFINALPDGFRTQIGENGSRLSGGQRQKLALARALLRNPPVLLLDEPSSHLDSEAEVHLCQQLRALSPDHAIVVATHSPLLLRACQRIVVLDAGRIVADGSAEEILARLTGKELVNQ